MKALGGLALAAFAAAAFAETTAPRLAPAAKVLAGREPIDVDVGHATPNVVDWNGDGKPDLLVGQFGGGKLRVYLNRGTKTEPRFGDFQWVQAGRRDATVPVS